MNLRDAIVHRSPPDIADWPETVRITRITMDPQGGLTVSFAPALASRWKWSSNPNDPADNYQWTAWAVVTIGGQLHADGFVQMWEGRTQGDRSLPPILTGFRDWWGDPRRLWGAMSDYVPQAGDVVGFFVSAGNGRDVTRVTSVRERSNLVEITLPAGDRGDFTFDTPAPPRADPPPPATPPSPNVPMPSIPPSTTDDDLAAVMIVLTEELHGLRDTLNGALDSIYEALRRIEENQAKPLKGPFGWRFRL